MWQGLFFFFKIVILVCECQEIERGEDYFGIINWIISGRQCMRWKDRIFGNQSYVIEGNYCRNSFFEKFVFWCYIKKYNKEFEICDILKC